MVSNFGETWRMYPKILMTLIAAPLPDGGMVLLLKVQYMCSDAISLVSFTVADVQCPTSKISKVLNN